jgi:hypothetical protein
VIRFALACSDGHAFEGWFAGSEAFDRQRLDGTLLCPVCGSADVDKALMTPAVATSRKRDPMRVAANVAPDPDQISALRKMRQHLTENAEYVGPRFAEEARKIHYNETEKRGIYGEASAEEVRGLSDEGIEFHPLPVLPEDHN